MAIISLNKPRKEIIFTYISLWFLTTVSFISPAHAQITLLSPENNTNYFTDKIPLTTDTGLDTPQNCWYEIDSIQYETECANQTVTSTTYTEKNTTIAFWKLDDNEGTQAADTSGYEKTATLTNFNTPGQTNWTSGKLGKALYFDGTDDYLSLNAYSSNQEFNTTTGAIELWFRPEPDSKFSQLFNFRKTGYADYIMIREYRESKISITAEIENAVTISLSTPAGSVNPGDWNHLLIQQTGEGLEVYINGERQTLSGTGSTNTMWLADAFPASYDITIGHYGGWSDDGTNCYYHGSIDEFRILNSTLTEDEVRQDYTISMGAHNITYYMNSTEGNISNTSATFLISAKGYGFEYNWETMSGIAVTGHIDEPAQNITISVYNSTEKLNETTIPASSSTENITIRLPDLNSADQTGTIPLTISLCAAEYCTNTSLPVYAKVRTFRELLAEAERIDQAYTPYEYYKSNSSSTLAWSEASHLASFTWLYKATLDTRYLDKLIIHTDFMLSNRHDYDGDGTGEWASADYSVSTINDEMFEDESAVFNENAWRRINSTYDTAYLDTSTKQCGSSSLKITTNTTTKETQWVARPLNNYTASAVYSWRGYIRTSSTPAWIKVTDETTGELLMNITVSSEGSFTFKNGDYGIYSFRAPNETDHTVNIWFAPLNRDTESAAVWLDGCAHTYDFVVNRWIIYPATHNGMVLKPITNFIRTVKTENLTEYDAKADEYLAIIESDFTPQGTDMKGMLEIMEWQCDDRDCAVMVPTDAEYQGTINMTIGLNRIYQYIRVMLDLYNITGNETYNTLAQKTTYWLKNYALSSVYDESDDAYYFAYRHCTDQSWDINSGCYSYATEDNSHAQLELAYMAEAYQDNTILNITDMQRIINVFMISTWNQSYDYPSLNSNIDGSGVYGSTYNYANRGWLEYAELEPDIYYIIERQMANGGHITGTDILETISKLMYYKPPAKEKLALGRNLILKNGLSNHTDSQTEELDLYMTPTKSSLNVTINDWDKNETANSLTINMTVESSIANNPTTIEICNMTESTEYTISKDETYHTTETSDPDGCLSFTNIGWSTHIFTIEPSTNETYNISGHIKDTAGTSIEYASITISGTHNTTTSQDGYYTITNLTAGLYDITASKAGYITNITTVSITTENRTGINITLSEDTTDTTTPNITIISPINESTLAYTTTILTLNISTDENATCHYNTTTPSFNFTESLNMTLTGATSHTMTISVTSGNTYTYYYKCNDTSGNINKNATIHTISVTSSPPDTSASSSGGGSSSSGGIIPSTPRTNTTNSTTDTKTQEPRTEDSQTTNATDNNPDTQEIDNILITKEQAETIINTLKKQITQNTPITLSVLKEAETAYDKGDYSLALTLAKKAEQYLTEETKETPSTDTSTSSTLLLAGITLTSAIIIMILLYGYRTRKKTQSNPTAIKNTGQSQKIRDLEKYIGTLEPFIEGLQSDPEKIASVSQELEAIKKRLENLKKSPDNEKELDEIISSLVSFRSRLDNIKQSTPKVGTEQIKHI